MKYELIIRPEAEEDMNQSYLWYEERREGLGAEFLLSVEATLESISRFPEMYPKIYKHVRRALLRRFPFGIFYFLTSRTL
jgi:plasmid stabilization system protein ParE